MAYSPYTGAGDVAHGSTDSGNPMKAGGKGSNALPTRVSNGQRTNLITDLWGRLLVSHIDPDMQVWKSFNAATQQTGADVWSPASGKKIAVTYLVVASYGTTTGKVVLWFGDTGDTTYSEGTDQVLWKGSFAPNANSKPGSIVAIPMSVFCTAADREIHITTDAAISIDVSVYGYEW